MVIDKYEEDKTGVQAVLISVLVLHQFKRHIGPIPVYSISDYWNSYRLLKNNLRSGNRENYNIARKLA